MVDRWTAYFAIAIVAVLLVVVPAASAGGHGAATVRDAGASPAEERGANGTPAAGPGVQAPPALASGSPDTGRDPVVRSSPAKPMAVATTAIAVTTAAAASVGDRRLSGGSEGRGDQEAGDTGPAARPTATPSTSRAAIGPGEGGDGNGRGAGEDAPAPGRSPTPVVTAATAGPTHARTGSPGTGQGPRDDVTPTTAPAKTGAIRPAGNGLSDEASPNEGTTAAPGTQSAGTSGTLPGDGNSARSMPPRAGEARGVNPDPASSGSVAGRGLDVGPPAPPASTITVSPAAGGAGHGRTPVAHAAGTGTPGQPYRVESPTSRGAGAGSRADPGEGVPTVRPSPGGRSPSNAGTVTGADRGAHAGGAGTGRARGHSRPQNAGQERGPPEPPAAPTARTGLEPADQGSADGGSGRGRRNPPAVPVSMETGDGVPDPLLFLRFLLFLGYRRVRPTNLLDHPVRRDLAAAIAADPGLDLAGCVVATGAHRETLRYHLALLACSGKILEETRNGSVRYFPRDPFLTPVNRAVIHLERNPSLAQALHHIRDRPGIPRRELAALLGVAGPSVTRQVQRLVDEGLVANRGYGPSQGYWLTPECAGVFTAITVAQAERGRGAQVSEAETA